MRYDIYIYMSLGFKRLIGGNKMPTRCNRGFCLFGTYEFDVILTVHRRYKSLFTSLQHQIPQVATTM